MLFCMQAYIKGRPRDADLRMWRKIRELFRITKDIMNKLEIILLPIVHEFHWYLLEMNMISKEFRFYNSFSGRRQDKKEGEKWVR